MVAHGDRSMVTSQCSCCLSDCYRSPNDPIKAAHWWGSAAHKEPTLGSNGILKVPVLKSHTDCHQPSLDPLLANVYQASPV